MIYPFLYFEDALVPLIPPSANYLISLFKLEMEQGDIYIFYKGHQSFQPFRYSLAPAAGYGWSQAFSNQANMDFSVVHS